MTALAKQQLRAQMKARRLALSGDEQASAARVVIQPVLQIVQAAGAATIGLYYPVRGEFSCLALLETLAARGLKTALPVVIERHDKLLFRPWKPKEALDQGDFDIPSPPCRGLSVMPDMLIVPLLAFDLHGGRLGYGGGYYDRTLQALRARNENLLAVGLAHDFQRVDDLVQEAHDQPLDAVVTPADVFRF